MKCFGFGLLIGFVVMGCAGPQTKTTEPLDPSAISANLVWQSGAEQCIRSAWGEQALLMAYREGLRKQLSTTPQAVIAEQSAAIVRNGGYLLRDKLDEIPRQSG